ncbi:MAG: JAB domain-containing protein [Pseudobdellovibrionaceae bacterium]
MTSLKSSDVFNILKNDFNPTAEEFWIITFNSELCITQKYMLYRGTVNQCPIHCRDIFRFVVTYNAASFLVAHNHPSYNPLPSTQDYYWTNKINKLSSLIQIPFLDHIIFCENSYFSFADAGYFKKY